MNLEDFIAALKKIPRESTLVGNGGVGACIQSTRAFIRVCKHFGFDAEPLAVSCAVYNDKWSVGCGWDETAYTPDAVQPNGNGADVHLVVWLPAHRVLIDPTIHVLTARPQYGLVIDCVVTCSVPPEFDAGEAVQATDAGITVTYKRSNYDGWRHTHAWQGAKAFTREYADEIIDKIKSDAPNQDHACREAA
jgi:hypothetical protein